MITFPIISFLIFSPIVCGFFIVLIRGDEEIKFQNARNVAFFANSLLIAAFLYVMFLFDASLDGYQFIERYDTSFFGKSFYTVGIDGISFVLMCLSSFVFIIVLLLSKDLHVKPKEYMASLLFLQFAVNGMLLSIDILMFFIFFEITSIVLFFLIGAFGKGTDKMYSLTKSLMYYAISSLFILAAIIYIYPEHKSLEGLDLSNYDKQTQYMLWGLLFIGFAMRTPLFPFHRWLVLLNNSILNSISVLIFGVVVNLSVYGMMRMVIMSMPETSLEFSYYVVAFLAISIIYFGAINIRQYDFKRIVTYNSIVQINIIMLGLFSFSVFGFVGMVIVMISQAVVSSGMLVCAEVLKKRGLSYDIKSLCGVGKAIPGLGLFVIVFVLSAIGGPFTLGFYGYVSIFVGLFENYNLMSIFVPLSIIIIPIYLLRVYKKIFMMKSEIDLNCDVVALTISEKLIFVLVVLPVVVLGICPWIITDTIQKAFVLAENLG